MLWYLYIAEARTGNYYVGISTDVARRIDDHNKGHGAIMAKTQGPFKLVYTSKPLPDQSTARKLEMKIKKWPRERKTNLISGNLNLSIDIRQ